MVALRYFNSALCFFLLALPLASSAHSIDDVVDENKNDVSGIFGVLCINTVAVVACALLVIFRYSDNRNNSVASALLITFGAVCASGLLALFPADLGQALGVAQGDVDPDTFGPAFKVLYRFFYWSSMAIAYVVLPSLELVIRSGAFGVRARITDALTQILTLLVGLVVGSALFTLIFLAAEKDWSGSILPKVEASLISLSNTLGLVQITLLLGCGLVELPRQIWRSSDLEGCLRRIRRSVVREYRARDDARTQLQMALDDVYRYQKLCDDDADKTRREATKAALRELLNVDFLAWSDEDHRRAKNRATANPKDFKWVADEGVGKAQVAKRSCADPLPLAELVCFRSCVKQWQRDHATSEGRVERVECAAWSCEDAKAAQAHNLKASAQAAKRKALPYATTTKLLGNGVGGDGGGDGCGGEEDFCGGEQDAEAGEGRRRQEGAVPVNLVEWWDGSRSGPWGFWWHVTSRPARSKAAAVFVGCLSLLIAAVTVDTLLVAAVGSKKEGGSSGLPPSSLTSALSPVAASLAVDAALCYLACVLGWTTTALAGSRENLLVPGRRTTTLALSYYARFALSACPALLFYVLQLLFPSLHATNASNGVTSGDDGGSAGNDTAFFSVYGSRVLVSSLAKNFSLFFPGALVVLMALQLFGCGLNRVLGLVGACSGFQFDGGLEAGKSSSSSSSSVESVDAMEVQRGENRLSTRRLQVTAQIESSRRLHAMNNPSTTSNPSLFASSLYDPPAYKRHSPSPPPAAASQLPDSLSPGQLRAGSSLSTDSNGLSLEDRTFEHVSLLSSSGSGAGPFDTAAGDSSLVQRRPSLGPGLGQRRNSDTSTGSGAAEGEGVFAFKSAAMLRNDSAAAAAAAASAASAAAPPLASLLPPAAVAQSSAEPQPRVHKSVAKCRKCGVVLPSDMEAIEKHDDECTGVRADEAGSEGSGGGGGGGGGGGDLGEGGSGDAGNGGAETAMIENAFVCPQCFAEFASQRQVLNHFAVCLGGSDHPATTTTSGTNSGGGGCAPVLSSSGRTSSSSYSSSSSSRSMTTRMFGAGGASSSSKLYTSLSPSGSGASADEAMVGAVDALNRQVGGEGSRGGVGPGMELKGWVEKHGKVKGWARRWMTFNAQRGQLMYFKFNGSDSFTGQPDPASLEIKGVLDIRYVVGVGHKPGVFRRVDIDGGAGKNYKLRLASDAEGRFWCEQILVWRDHFAM